MDRESAAVDILLFGEATNDGAWHFRLLTIGFQGGFIGRVFDSYGPRGLMLGGAVCYALSMVATAFSTHYTHYMLSQGLFFGLSVGLL